ncbi:ankyrin repeat domain-containing protein, partial [archaeon]
CRLLLDKGVDVNHVANSGGTALMFAAGGGHLEASRLLLARGADVNVAVLATPDYIEQVAKGVAEGKEDVEPHKDGVTALSLAAQGGHLDLVHALVDAQAAVDVADEEDETPLLASFKNKHYNVSYYLLEHGANPNDVYVDDKRKMHSLLLDSVQLSNVPLATLLVQRGANLSVTDEEGVTPLIQAAYQGHNSLVMEMLSKGADITAANAEGINALIAAASEGHADVVRTLLAHPQSDVNSKDNDGTNALMAAAVRGHKAVLLLLLEHKVDINAQNTDGHTALMFAYNGKNQVETLLDKYSEYMKEMNGDSMKIIREAVQTHLDVVSLLLQYGADASIKVSALYCSVSSFIC